MITLEKVSFTYRSGQRALQDVDLNIEGGDFIAIMGENGAGKTTLAKHLNGLLKPSQGRVLVDGEDTRKVSVARLSRKVGLVFQNPDHLLFSETVKDEVAFGLKNFGFAPEVVHNQVIRTLEALVRAAVRRLFGELTKYGLPSDVVDVHRARILLEEKLSEAKVRVAQNS